MAGTAKRRGGAAAMSAGEQGTARRVLFRKMELQDLEAVHRIESECFTLPWSLSAFYNELVNNHFATYLVMEVDGQLAGYGGMWNIIDEAHVTNIAVRPSYQGRGLGKRLLRELMALAAALGSRRMTLEVRVSNHIAIRLYEQMGFRATGVRKEYYSDNREDALVMWADLPAPGDPPLHGETGEEEDG